MSRRPSDPVPHRPVPSRPVGSPATPCPRLEIGHPAGEDLWVFAYGSLMWNPGFHNVDRREAWLHGWHRGFCVYSWRHRGTPEVPGAVLGLDRGGSCRGIAYRVPSDAVDATLDYLWEREMMNRVYVPRRVQVRFGPGTRANGVTALAFSVDRGHPQYCGRLPVDDLVRLVRQGIGQSGRSIDYLTGLIAHLRDLGIRDHTLEDLAARATAGA